MPSVPRPLIQYSNIADWRARCGSTLHLKYPNHLQPELKRLLNCDVCIAPVAMPMDIPASPCVVSLNSPSLFRYPVNSSVRYEDWPSVLTASIESTTVTTSTPIVGQTFALVWNDDAASTANNGGCELEGWENTPSGSSIGNVLILQGLAAGTGTVYFRIAVGAACDYDILGGAQNLNVLALKVASVGPPGADYHVGGPEPKDEPPLLDCQFVIPVSDFSAIDETVTLTLYANFISYASPGTILGEIVLRISE